MDLDKELDALWARDLDNEWEHMEADALVFRFLAELGYELAAKRLQQKADKEWWYA